MTTFTWEQLEEIAKANVCRISYDGFRVSPSDLAAFAIALLDQKEKLRKCVKAADAFFLTEDAMCTAAEEGTGNDLWLESQEHRYAYDAARAEVDK